MSRSTLYSSVCADCSSPDPTWASINRGVLICDECCSVHRSLGRHISQVKSLRKGQWCATQHAMVYQLTNQGANNIWEHALLDPSQNKHGRRKPNPRDPLHPNKSDFIRAKYQFLSFVNKHKDSDVSSIDDVSKELHSSVRTNNVETCLRLLSKGADPNYFHMEKGNCPLHIAAQAGQSSQMELLVVYGADPGALDLGGKTPVDYARVEGHNDLADRLVEAQYELTDRLAYYICGKKPDHRTNVHFIIPEMGDSSSDLSELAKQAKKKLQALPNHLFEELAMDVYDEVDRRENDSIWSATHDHSTTVSDRQTVPFLPVNPDLSTTRNQGRQKLARFNAREFTTLIIDILNDARRRQTGIASPTQTPKEQDKSNLSAFQSRISKTGSAFSDDEPLYDSVASDEDYSSIDTQSIKSVREEMKKDKPADDQALKRSTPTSIISFTESMLEQVEGPVSTDEYVEVKKALAVSQSKIQLLAHDKHDLEKRVQIMQSTINTLLRENQALRVRNLREAACASPPLPNGLPTSTSPPVENQDDESLQSRKSKTGVRPQSMFEPREQLKSSLQKGPSKEDVIATASSVANIHINADGQASAAFSLPEEPPDQDLLNANIPEPDYDTIVPNLEDRPQSEVFHDCSSMLNDAGAKAMLPADDAIMELPSQEEVVHKTEKITKKIQELLQTAQEGNLDSYGPCSDKIYLAVTEMESIFPKNVKTDTVSAALQLLTTSATRLRAECIDCLPLAGINSEYDPAQKTHQIIQFAYDIAKAAKQLVTLFQ
ncbi:ARF GTPase-activating protein GIT2-like [Gigantopelta aegis]|uniref:ARF GTPase-activating protein GIT2-like n=1 Tax=Gigantopelta aegis TaxID=1735272 RepID=UPI001B88A08F|nr:ARF GTPase-activating protein GIT2-like [Gigantopelta aegis]